MCVCVFACIAVYLFKKLFSEFFLVLILSLNLHSCGSHSQAEE